MIEGLVGLLMAAEIERTQLGVQETVDTYYTEQAQQAAQEKEITFDVTTRGTVRGDETEFAEIVEKTLVDSRGWVRAGVKFRRVESGGQLHMVLAEASQVAAAAPGGCSADLSCTVKPYVLINDTRWMNGSDSYNQLGVSLQSYRQMVINHEVGHFLGHDHIVSCETATGLAPIMLQQSTGLLGCRANSWPLPSELWTKGV